MAYSLPLTSMTVQEEYRGMGNRANLSGKRVVVLGDRQILAEAIKLTLKKLLEVEIVERTADALFDRGEVEDLDLIVMAASSPVSELPSTLARAPLGDVPGRVSLLVISDRAFDADPKLVTYHLHFPFACDQLCDKVQEILNGNGRAHARETARPMPAATGAIREPGRYEETVQ